MRWATVFALFLLTMIAPCSNDGILSASLLSTTDPPTADFMGRHTAVNDSTSEAGEASSITSSEQNEVSQDSSSSYTGPSEESSQEEDEESADHGDDKPPSTGDDSRLAPYPQPSIGYQADVQSQALEGGPTPQNTNLTADLEGRSISEINSRLEKAKLRESALKGKRDSEKDAWEKKKKEAGESKKDYDKKNEIWKGLDKIAIKTAESWKKDVKNNRTATREYENAEKLLKQINEGIISGGERLTEIPSLIQKATEEREEIEKRDATLDELKKNKTRKIDGKPALSASIPILTKAESDSLETRDDAESKAKTSQTNFDNDGCNKPENLENCRDKKSSLVGLKEDAQRKREIYEKALEALNNANTELTNFDEDLKKINDEIGRLERAKPNYDRDLSIAQEKEANLKLEETEQKKTVADLERSKPAAESEEEKKRIARDEANEKVKNGRPPEVDNTRNSADSAFDKVDTANHTMHRIYGELSECKANLDIAQASLTEAESDVTILTDRLAQAKSQEQPQKGSILPYAIGGPVLFLLIAVAVVVAVMFLVRKNKKKKNGEKIVKKSEAPSKTGSRVGSRVQTPSTIEEQNPLVKPASDTPVIRVQPGSPNSTPPNNDKVDANGLIIREQGPEGHVCGPVEAVCKSGCGQYRDVIAAKDIKFLGPITTHTRWHGEPIHDFEGQEGVTYVKDIRFDRNANYAREIGRDMKVVDGGPPSDSDRSEWLKSLHKWDPVTKTRCNSFAGVRSGIKEREDYKSTRSKKSKRLAKKTNKPKSVPKG